MIYSASRKALAVAITSFICLSPVGLAKGGGGRPEPVGNNLSFPVIWSDGDGLPLPGTMLQATLTVPYSVSPCVSGGFAYAQKTEGNVWQAENTIVSGMTFVDEIDWGDSLESVDMKIGRPVRIELSLYKRLVTPMLAYTMVMLANPSSPDEVQGVCATGEYGTDNGANIESYLSSEATVYSPLATLVVQKLLGPNVSWDGTQWVGDVGSPVELTFAGELNVAGKVIYGLAQGGWKPTSAGQYRITFFLPHGGNTHFSESTIIRTATETALIAPAADDGEAGGQAVVDWANNLTFIDVTVVTSTGGGGKK